MALAVAAICLRLPSFGHPTYHLDEAFYLFVGQAMGDGLIPYADIWDRKPAGLFVLYFLIAQLGDVHAYQSVAALFAWGTAVLIARMAILVIGPHAATCAGVLYLAGLPALAGGGGQAAVFYNLFMVAAALLALRQAVGTDVRHLAWHAIGAMLLCGVAITIKPTALPEGIFIGLVLCATHADAYRDARRTALFAAGMIAAAALPTVLIWTWFAAIGQFSAYWFATMQSVFYTRPAGGEADAVRLSYLALITWPLACTAAAGLAITIRNARTGQRSERAIAIFALGWVAASIAGFVMIGNYYDHYALPLVAATAFAAAPLFHRQRAGALSASLAVAYLLAVAGFPLSQTADNARAQAGYAAAQATIARHVGGGCLLIYDATPALYRSFRACRGTRLLFPEHLANAREAHAIGADPVAEMRSVLGAEPRVIVRAAKPSLSTPNLETAGLLSAHLAGRYQRVGFATLIDVVGSYRVEIWAAEAPAATPLP